LVRKL